MSDPLIVEVLIWFHVFSVVGWFGAALVFLMVIEPSLPKLSPQTSGEIVLKVFPKFVRYIQVFAVSTLAFGIALALTMSNGDLGIFGLGSAWGLEVTVGASFGFATFLLVFFLLAPSVKKLGKIIVQMQRNPQQPPPSEFRAIQERLKFGAPTAVLLLSLAMVFMVAAGGT